MVMFFHYCAVYGCLLLLDFDMLCYALSFDFDHYSFTGCPVGGGEAGTGTYFPRNFQYISHVREDPFIMSYGHHLVQGNT